MDTNTYKLIRGHPNFLFRYYEKEGGILREPQFNNLFNMWLSAITGQNPMMGQQIIIQDLDKKFGYVKNSP